MIASKKNMTLRFLHITDCHLSTTESVKTSDRKTKAPGMSHPLRTDVFQNTLRTLASKLNNDGVKLDAVLFSGDGTFQGDPQGQILLRQIVLSELGQVGISNSNLVVTPGNHDIVKGTLPNSPDRYQLFKNAWIEPGPVIVPFLEGINNIKSFNPMDHVLKDENGTWAVFPINTANWSQLILQNDENPKIANLRKYVAEKGDVDLGKTLEELCTYDVARVSDEQLEALKAMVDQAGDVRLRIAVLHHHLLPVNTQEEFKAFADITNLGHLRQVLCELGFHLVVHGHKHVTAAYYDHIYLDKLESAPAHRILTISGGTFGPTGQHPDNPCRLIEIDEIPYAPICKITNIRSASAGRELNITESQPYRLWEDDPTSKGPAIIYGTTIDDVYARAIQTVQQSSNRTLICTINFQSDEEVPFPVSYPYGNSHDERREWFEETVKWWQLPASRIEARIPYIHGSRLKRFGGSLNQIDRVVSLLKNQKVGSNEQATSKAIALVVDPGRDFTNEKTPFASFCFVQFCIRPENRLDCIGYFRAQEFNYWWPVNVAELRYLQKEVANRAQLNLGEITTISPYPRLSKNIRQPNKVAVPLIDQWVDNHPVRIAKIALALADTSDSLQSNGLSYWKRCLDDLEQTVTEFHSEGVQVSIEGLELLKDWLGATSDRSDEIIQLINDLLHANKSYQDSTNGKEEFDRWQKQVQQKLKKLREITIT